jgi:hypothetical protein
MAGNEQTLRVHVGLLAQILGGGQHVINLIVEIQVKRTKGVSAQ